MDSFTFIPVATPDRGAAAWTTRDVAQADTGTNKYERDVPQEFHDVPPFGGIDDWGC